MIIPYPDLQRLIEIFAYFSTNYYLIFYILTKCATNLEKGYLHISLFVWQELKAQFTFFILAEKQTFFGCSYNILPKMY